MWRLARIAGSYSLAIVLMTTTGCASSPETALEHLLESRRLTADLVVQFTKATDASNRAVMADTDEASVSFAREAEQATQAVEKDGSELTPVLSGLGYSNETGLLEEFKSRFAEYRALDKNI